jgi:energy-coupling factor transport system ATP-binding protein
MGTSFEKHALKDISFKIDKGEFIGLIGHTGSGKSTLIQHMNGLIRATSGKIFYNGEDIYDKNYNMRSLRSKVGLVFQYPEHQLFETTVYKDVNFGPKNLGLDKLEADLRTYEALKMVGIGEDLLDVSPFELSGGQKKKSGNSRNSCHET